MYCLLHFLVLPPFCQRLTLVSSDRFPSMLKTHNVLDVESPSVLTRTGRVEWTYHTSVLFEVDY